MRRLYWLRGWLVPPATCAALAKSEKVAVCECCIILLMSAVLQHSTNLHLNSIVCDRIS